MTEKELKKLVSDMRKERELHGFSQRTIQKGLTITYTDKVLSLTRLEKYPSEREVRIVAKLFGLHLTNLTQRMVRNGNHRIWRLYLPKPAPKQPQLSLDIMQAQTVIEYA